ncbi:transcriptional regulator, TrmB [Rubrobacter xylanophilus DSM 9941]|uniref:Transcriptional regulator, TrmB n=1 Tax=Rubrobacter xylanophilus (strain DSM 9941 / JCM 11954 / NBRC 16129 / PRD-1) TaxID=266117 RepID=Q1AX53_RUBXD|nr:MarR family transcriptional regulator [Rubrobacter xylanophilus]ABG04025.1 transcriptional regulator, TrmB [Rubrobacter xylanophilus DSM 9941]
MRLEKTAEVRGSRSTGHLLARVCREYRQHVGGLLSRLELHPGQEMVLLELWREDGLRGGELARRLRVEPPTVTRTVRRLEGCGLVERRPDPEDARCFRVFLTPRGRSLRGPVARCWESAEADALRGLRPAERAELHRLLLRVHENLASRREVG